MSQSNVQIRIYSLNKHFAKHQTGQDMFKANKLNESIAVRNSGDPSISL